jgi:small-conductance mechanosensitive channel/CRP-like cAMP-binding protein
MPEDSSGFIQIVGFFLFLSGVALILVRITLALTRGNVRRLRLAAEIVLIWTVIFWFTQSALTFAGLETWAVSASNAIAFLWAISLAFLINTALNQILWEGLLTNHGIRQIPKLLTDGLGLAVYVLAIMLVLHFVYGEPIGAVLATSGAAAVVIGFGAQSTIREVFSGVALSTTQALRIGDYVEINDVYGQVYDINWRSVSIKSPHTDSLYIFPNSAVAEQTILNFSEPTDRFRYYVKFSAELSAPPELVIRAIAQELENSRHVFRDPKPDFNILGYSEKGIDYRVRFHFDGDDPWWDAQNEICMAIWAAMRKHGLRISMNRMLQSSAEEWPAIDERVAQITQPEDVLSALKRHPIFGVLSEDELAQLMTSYKVSDLGPPSCYFEPNDESLGLHFVLEGAVGLIDIAEDGNELMVETCLPGTVFGVKPAIKGGKHQLKAQANQYSIAVCFLSENVQAVVKQNAQLEKSLIKLIKQQAENRNDARARELKAKLLIQHQRQRRSIKDDLRIGMDDLLQKPALHHLFDHFSKRVQNEELLEGIMAGAALIASARGVVDDVEVAFLRVSITETGISKHLNIDHGLALFQKYSDMLIDGQKADEDRVHRALREALRIKNGSKVVVKICQGLCGVHGLPTKQELSTLTVIAHILGEEIDIESLLSESDEAQTALPTKIQKKA